MTQNTPQSHAEFSIGQRYLSDTEAELGLGVVVAVDERCVHILFPQSEETRVYAQQSAPLSRVTFKVGDTISDQDGSSYKVTGVSELMGVVKYEVQGLDDGDGAPQKPLPKSIMETRLSANITLAKPLERLLAGRIERGDSYELRQDILRMQTAIAGHPLKGLMGARVDIIEHQLYIAHEVGKRLAPRVLLADEVGLGKTIEAGMIIHQQLITGKAERVLVLVPDSLQYQWMIELRRRFNLNFSLFDLVHTASIKEHNPEQNVFATEQCIIASLDLLLDHHDLYEQAMEAGFDLLVVDEAHHLHWDSEQGGNEKYDLVADFAETTAGVLLLTATPEQLGVESHFARLRLLDPDRFDDLDDFIASSDAFAQTAQVATVLMDEQELTDGQITALSHLLGMDEDKLANDESHINTDPNLRQQVLNDLLDRHGTGRVLFRNTRESVQGFYGRTCQSYPLPLPDSWVDSYQSNGKLREQLWGEENHPDGSWLEDDPRVPWLINILKTELKQEKVLLIARSGATVESLEAVLRLHAGIKTAVFTEQMTLLERDQASAYFADREGAQILLCSEIGSEGRNFQFASHLVLFDLPANPDTLEQRIGRLDRIGQSRQITLHVPYVTGTAQERLFHWYDGALNIFNQISPTAQTVQETFMMDLKPALEGKLTQDDLETLVTSGANTRLRLEAELQAGRDRLLEYNSCRPRVAKRIADTMADLDKHNVLPAFFERFLSVANIDHSEQRDGTWVIHPPESGRDEQIDSLPIAEEGMTITFKRHKALKREEVDYITHEHPLMQAIYEMANSGTFGNVNVAMIKSNAIPEGMLLLESTFRVHPIAPRLLNLTACLPKQNLRILISEQGQDLSERITADMINPHIAHLDKNRARQVVKLRQSIIQQKYADSEELAKAQLADISEQAKAKFSQQWQREIDRLKHLQSINPNVRASEIDRLETLKTQGEQALDNLSLIPDSVRVMVVVRD